MSYHKAVCGQSGCGKSTYAMRYSAMAYRLSGRRSLAFDPNGADWGPHCLVCSDLRRVADFWYFVWRAKNCVVFVDEVATVMPRDAEANEVFTRIRHRGHQLVMILHEAANLLPVQRDACSTLVLFNQHPRSAQLWADAWNEPRLAAAPTLRKYEFLFAQKFADPVTGLHEVQRGKLAL